MVKLLLDFFYSRMFVLFLLLLLLLLLLLFSFSIRLLPSRVMNASLEDTRMPQNKTNASYVLLGISNICLINHFVYRVVLDYIKTKLKGKILLFDINNRFSNKWKKNRDSKIEKFSAFFFFSKFFYLILFTY